VTFQAGNGWLMNEVHLFIGDALTTMPQTRTGNPQVGQFPYGEKLDGQSHYSLTLPLGDFGAAGTALAVAAHAAVSREQADGKMESGSAWAGSDRIVQRGNWATWFSYVIAEVDEPLVAGCLIKGSAFAYSEQAFRDLGNGVNRWGWQITLDQLHGYSGSTPLYMGAGNNDLSKATRVGDFDYSYANGILQVSYSLNSGFSLDATHVYAGTSFVDTSAPGQYGHENDDLPWGATYDHYTIDVDGEVIYLVGHATVCVD
jgi:hypothetical protein